MIRKLGLLIGLGVLAGACATEKVSLAKVAPPAVVIETVPTGARVAENGADRGITPLVFSASGPEVSHELTLSLPGYHPGSMRISGRDVVEHNGERMLLVLRPDIWAASEPPIDPADEARLELAAKTLSRTDRCPEAVQFFKRMLQLDPRAGVAHKGMGICFAKMNRRSEALDAYKKYLLHAPDAPDAEKVRQIVSRAEGDIHIPPPKRDDDL
jgi:hypothetical protein